MYLMYSQWKVVVLALFVPRLCFSAVNHDGLKFLQQLEVSKVIIDSDAGGDDAVAILLAIEHMRRVGPPFEIIAITCTVGNTAVDNVVVNVLKTLKTADSMSIPVYIGANNSILMTRPSDNVFGEDGFGDFEFPNPPSAAEAEDEIAAAALVRLARENPGEITIISIGPLTNIGLATRLDRNFRKNLKNIFVMGGSLKGQANMYPGIEFNALMDPEANFIVYDETREPFNPVIVFPWDTTVLTSVTEMSWRIEVLGKLNSSYVDFLNKAERKLLNTPLWTPADAKTMFALLEPKMVLEASRYHIDAVTEGFRTRGQLIVDYSDLSGGYMNAIIIDKLNETRFREMLLEYFSNR